MIKNIIFDIGDVLVKGIPNDILDNLDITGKDKELINKTFFSDFSDLDLGNSTLKDKINISLPNYLIEKYGTYLLNYYKYRIINKELFEIISKLRGNNYNIYIFSDNYKEAINYYKSLDEFKNIDYWIVSCDYHKTKKNKELFSVLVNEYKLNLNECYYIDDKEEYIDYALSLGMRGYVYSFKKDKFNDLIDNMKENNINIS